MSIRTALLLVLCVVFGGRRWLAMPRSRGDSTGSSGRIHLLRAAGSVRAIRISGVLDERRQPRY